MDIKRRGFLKGLAASPLMAKGLLSEQEASEQEAEPQVDNRRPISGWARSQNREMETDESKVRLRYSFAHGTDHGRVIIENELVSFVAVYSRMKRDWKTDSELIKYPFPATLIAKGLYEMEAGWTFEDPDRVAGAEYDRAPWLNVAVMEAGKRTEGDMPDAMIQTRCLESCPEHRAEWEWRPYTSGRACPFIAGIRAVDHCGYGTEWDVDDLGVNRISLRRGQILVPFVVGGDRKLI